MPGIQWDKLDPELQRRIAQANPEVGEWVGYVDEDDEEDEEEYRQVTRMKSRKSARGWDAVLGGMMANYWTRWLVWFTVLMVVALIGGKL